MHEQVDPDAVFSVVPDPVNKTTSWVANQMTAQAALSSDVVSGSKSAQILNNATLICDVRLAQQNASIDTFVDPNQSCQNKSDLVCASPVDV